MASLQEGITFPDHEADNLPDAPGNNTITDSAVSIVPLTEFVANLPETFFAKVQATELPKASISAREQDSILICIEDNMLMPHRLIFPEKRERVMRMQTVDQLNDLADQLLSRSLLMVVRAMFWVKRPERWNLQVEYLAVLINTRHSSIQPQLDAELKKALRSCYCGKRYALELNFNHIVCDWLKVVLHHDHLLWKSSKRGCQFFAVCDGANLVITNSSEYNSLFDVQSGGYCGLWAVCCPCCCVACPLYTVNRYLTVDDHRVKVRGTARYWDLRNLSSSPEEGLNEDIRETLTGGETNWNHVFNQLREGAASRQDGLAPDTVTAQPRTVGAGGLPSYEEAILMNSSV